MPVIIDYKNNSRYHKQTMCTQKSFHKKVKSFSDVVKEMGNPFLEESANLLVIDRKNVADPALASTICTLHQRGKYQILSFTERFEKTAEVSYFKQILKQHKGSSKKIHERPLSVVFTTLYLIPEPTV